MSNKGYGQKTLVCTRFHTKSQIDDNSGDVIRSVASLHLHFVRQYGRCTRLNRWACFPFFRQNSTKNLQTSISVKVKIGVVFRNLWASADVVSTIWYISLLEFFTLSGALLTCCTACFPEMSYSGLRWRLQEGNVCISQSSRPNKSSQPAIHTVYYSYGSRKAS